MKIKIFFQSLALTVFCVWMVVKAVLILEPYGVFPLIVALCAIVLVFVCVISVIDSQIDHNANEESPK